MPDWREHVEPMGPSVIGIKKHGRMVTDAAIVGSDLQAVLSGDERAPEQLVNAASLPGAVGRVWAMAYHHFGYGLPIGGVLATDHESGDLGGAVSPKQQVEQEEVAQRGAEALRHSSSASMQHPAGVPASRFF